MGTDVLSLLVLLAVVVLMFFDKIPSTIVALLGALVCCLMGLYEPAEILSGIGSSTAVLIIGLTIIGEAFFRSGLAQKFSNRMLKLTGNTERGLIFGILLTSTILSAFASNTAIVITLIPIVRALSKEANVSLKRTMYPLSAGAALGGGLTLIGGNSNIAGNQVLINGGLPQMNFFTLGAVGLPVAIIGIVYFMTLGVKLLPKDEGYVEFERSAGFDDKIAKVTTSRRKMILSGIIIGLSVIAMMISTTALFIVALIGAALLILTGCLTEKEAFNSVDLKLLVLISSFSVISESIVNAGGDKLIANAFISVVGNNANPWLICLALFLLTSLLTHFLSNIVAISLMGPIAIMLAGTLGVNPVAMVITTIVAGNCCYATPLGSPYFTIMMPVANYKFKDFVRMGLPLVVINCVVAVLILPLIFHF